MKRTLMVSAVTAQLLTPPALFAAENDEPETYRQEWQGMGIGALAGAIVGGPPGFVIGVAGGALIGRDKGLEGDLEETRKEVGDLQDEVGRLRHRLSQGDAEQVARTREREAARNRREAYLDAVTNGFALNIQFRTESAELEPRFRHQLAQAIAILRAFPELTALVDGYADRRGSKAFNLTLTQRRGRVVASYLEAAGIDTSRVRTLSHGESRAEYPQSDAEGMDFDRRVLLRFSRTPS